MLDREMREVDGMARRFRGMVVIVTVMVVVLLLSLGWYVDRYVG